MLTPDHISRLLMRPSEVDGMYKIDVFPEDFPWASLVEVPEQEFDYSCGHEMVELVCRLLHLDYSKEKIKEAIGLTEEGVDPIPMYLGMKNILGINCELITGANSNILKKYLDDRYVAIWLGQDQETEPIDLVKIMGGHYMMAVHYDDMNFYFADSGWYGGKSFIPCVEIDDLWFDYKTGNPDMIYYGYMIVIPNVFPNTLQ